jgi:hypothetical protein
LCVFVFVCVCEREREYVEEVGVSDERHAEL